jgi:hypothetical protein
LKSSSQRWVLCRSWDVASPCWRVGPAAGGQVGVPAQHGAGYTSRSRRSGGGSSLLSALRTARSTRAALGRESAWATRRPRDAGPRSRRPSLCRSGRAAQPGRQLGRYFATAEACQRERVRLRGLTHHSFSLSRRGLNRGVGFRGRRHVSPGVPKASGPAPERASRRQPATQAWLRLASASTTCRCPSSVGLLVAVLVVVIVTPRIFLDFYLCYCTRSPLSAAGISR